METLINSAVLKERLGAISLAGGGTFYSKMVDGVERKCRSTQRANKNMQDLMDIATY